MSKEVEEILASIDDTLSDLKARVNALAAENDGLRAVNDELQAEVVAVYEGALRQGTELALKDEEIARLRLSYDGAAKQAQRAREERDAAEAAAQAAQAADDTAVERLLLNAKVNVDDLQAAKWPRKIPPVTAMEAREAWARRRMPSDMHVYWVPDQETLDAIMGDDRIKDGHAFREPVWLQSARGTVAGWVAARRPLPDLGLDEVTDPD